MGPRTNPEKSVFLKKIIGDPAAGRKEDREKLTIGGKRN